MEPRREPILGIDRGEHRHVVTRAAQLRREGLDVAGGAVSLELKQIGAPVPDAADGALACVLHPIR